MYLQRKNADMPGFLHEKGKKNQHIYLLNALLWIQNLIYANSFNPHIWGGRECNVHVIYENTDSKRFYGSCLT